MHYLISALVATALVAEGSKVDEELLTKCRDMCTHVGLEPAASKSCAHFLDSTTRPFLDAFSICRDSRVHGLIAGCLAGCEKQTCFGFGNSRAVKEARGHLCDTHKRSREREGLCNSEYSSGAGAACTDSATFLANAAAEAVEVEHAARARGEAEELARMEADLAAAQSASVAASREHEERTLQAERRRAVERAAADKSQAAADAEAAKAEAEERAKAGNVRGAAPVEPLPVQPEEEASADSEEEEGEDLVVAE